MYGNVNINTVGAIHDGDIEGQEDKQSCLGDFKSLLDTGSVSLRRNLQTSWVDLIQIESLKTLFLKLTEFLPSTWCGFIRCNSERFSILPFTEIKMDWIATFCFQAGTRKENYEGRTRWRKNYSPDSLIQNFRAGNICIKNFNDHSITEMQLVEYFKTTSFQNCSHYVFLAPVSGSSPITREESKFFLKLKFLK